MKLPLSFWRALSAALIAVLALTACVKDNSGSTAEAGVATGGATGGGTKVATFVFTAIPDQDEQRLRLRFEKVARYLEQSLDVPVKYIPVKSYAAAVTAFANNHVQLAWFGGLSGVQARLRVPDSRAIAQGVEDPEFLTYFIANINAGISRADVLPESLIGKSFTFGSKGSTSGRLMPEYHIRERFNAKPDDVFSAVGFSGDHSRTIALVQSGAFDVGATNYKVWQKELASGKVDTSKVGVIWITPPYPDYQWTIRGDVNQQWGASFAEKVQQAILAMDDPDLLASFPRSGFIPASNADFDPILQTGKQIGLLD